MPLSVIKNIVTRRYSDFRGIDLLNAETDVDVRRSPDCLNVWKSYSLEQSNIIQTRPGFKKLVTLGENQIYGMYIWSNDTAIVHIGNKLIKWVGFPNEIISSTELFSNMNENKSVMFFFGEAIYILDGTNYLKFDGTNLVNVSDIAFVPTTTIGRSPSGGGEIYQDINLIQPKRKNSFIGDGTSTQYFLDSVGISSVLAVYVNDVLVSSSDYSVNLPQGKITFNTVPSSPSVRGQDNVIIEFSKTVTGYSERILGCTIAKVFDNRVFFSGNEDYSNDIFHSSLNDPTYISDLDYYECGTEENPIKSLVVGNNVLWVLKKDSQTKDTIFYMTPSNATDYGRIYPTSQGNVSIGCYSKAINYKDNIVFFSRNGLEGISGNIEYEQSITHKSSLIDSKLINMSNYEFLNVAEYNGYLVVSIDNMIFLADYRQLFKGVNGTEYEWYLWELPVNITYLKEYEEKLYMTDLNGNVYTFEGTNDLGQAFESRWVTPRDTFGYMQHLKKINKRGAILKIRNIQNGRLKIAEKTNKSIEWKLVKEAVGQGFDFNNLDFSNFSFVTNDNTYIVFRVKEKKIIDISLKIYSDILNKPFGLSEITLEAFISGYVKR